MKERLVLVRDFGELKAGMIVVVKNCRWCQLNHREMIVRLHIPPPGAIMVDTDGNQEPSVTLWLSARPVCSVIAARFPRSNRHFVGPSSIAERRVYRVIDGLESTTETTKRKKAPARP